jgi:hypothetical protein
MLTWILRKVGLIWSDATFKLHEPSATSAWIHLIIYASRLSKLDFFGKTIFICTDEVMLLIKQQRTTRCCRPSCNHSDSTTSHGKPSRSIRQ